MVTDRQIEISALPKQSLCAHARRLLASGDATRSDKLIGLRGGKPAISASVGWWADHTVRETAIEGSKFVRYKAFPAETVRPQTPENDEEVS